MQAGLVEALRSVYAPQPCQVLPNALWKTIARLPEMDCRTEGEDRVRKLEIWNESQLLCFWTESRSPAEFNEEAYRKQDLLLLHDDYLPAIDRHRYNTAVPYFRMSYAAPAAVPQEAGGEFRQVDPESELHRVAGLLNTCYPGGNWSPAAVRHWTLYAVYDPALWFWILAPDGTPVGLGIGEVDRSVPEGSLEWIQVLPAYRRAGYGSRLVAEMVRRMLPGAARITVSGRLDSPSGPDRLYRRCGFSGEDTWWVLRK